MLVMLPSASEGRILTSLADCNNMMYSTHILMFFFVSLKFTNWNLYWSPKILQIKEIELYITLNGVSKSNVCNAIFIDFSKMF
jgi:hypothetical protein